MSEESGTRSLFAELKRRNVFRVAALYAVVAWVLIQIGEATFEPLGLPDGSQRLLIILLGLGFPVAVVLAWIFDLTPEGIVRTPDDPAAEVAHLRTGRRIDFAIIGAAAMGDDGDLFDFDLRQAHIARAIIGNARHVILAVDASKFGRAAPVRIGHIGQAHTFVTDTLADQRLGDLCEAHEVDLVEALPAGDIGNARIQAS